MIRAANCCGHMATSFLQGVVLGAGLEPARLSAYAPQTYVSANSTTRAISRAESSSRGKMVRKDFFKCVQRWRWDGRPCGRKTDVNDAKIDSRCPLWPSKAPRP